MRQAAGLYILGEVLYDRFPDGQSILGGAPFNVAWHLQALGDKPQFISRVGEDDLGDKVLGAMQDWGMDRTMMQTDNIHPTGQVTVSFENGEPSYDIVNNCAYDFIAADQLLQDIHEGILYHGSLSLRNRVSYSAYEKLISFKNLRVYLDVNLRSPWWNIETIMNMIPRATWLKLNVDELEKIAGDDGNIKEQITRLQSRYDIEQVIVTRGKEGALIRTASGKWYSKSPAKVESIVDTVGAGDAFSAMYLHGLLAGLDVMENLQRSQAFAGKIVGVRGATTSDSSFYKEFIEKP